MLVLFNEKGKPTGAHCFQCAREFDRRNAPKIVTAPPDGMTARIYVEERLSALPVEGMKEIPHVEWLNCRSAKENCTLATAIREFRRRERDSAGKEFVQVHGYPSIYIERMK